MNSLPKTVTRQTSDCDLNTGPSAPESRLQHANHSATEPLPPLKSAYGSRTLAAAAAAAAAADDDEDGDDSDDDAVCHTVS